MVIAGRKALVSGPNCLKHVPHDKLKAASVMFSFDQRWARQGPLRMDFVRRIPKLLW